MSPASLTDDAAVYKAYSAEFKAQGRTDREIAATIASLTSIGDRAAIERWNRILRRNRSAAPWSSTPTSY